MRVEDQLTRKPILTTEFMKAVVIVRICDVQRHIARARMLHNLIKTENIGKRLFWGGTLPGEEAEFTAYVRKEGRITIPT